MTEDTRFAIEVITPIAEVLGIDEVWADGTFLYLDGNRIGIACNSTYATVMEFIGYCIRRYSERFRDLKLTDAQVKAITRYWSEKGANE